LKHPEFDHLTWLNQDFESLDNFLSIESQSSTSIPMARARATEIASGLEA
jgi:hypothetical protein